jgi:hypothetical protein
MNLICAFDNLVDTTVSQILLDWVVLEDAIASEQLKRLVDHLQRMMCKQNNILKITDKNPTLNASSVMYILAIALIAEECAVFSWM